MLTDIKRLIDRAYQVEKQNEVLELRVLQSQQLHFYIILGHNTNGKLLEYDAFILQI